MKELAIIFSPTGGTKKAAEMFMSGWSDTVETVDLSNQDFDGATIGVDGKDRVLIAMPCFGGRVPSIAVERLREIVGNGASCVVMCVYGNRAFEDGLIEMADAAKEAGFVVVAGIAAIAQHSIMPQYASGRPDASDLEQLRRFAKTTVRLLEEGKDATESIPGNHPYKAAGSVPLVPAVGKECTRCGTCAEMCPVAAIDPSSFVANKKACIACMRCIDVCSAHARSTSKLMVKIAAASIRKVGKVRKEPELFA